MTNTPNSKFKAGQVVVLNSNGRLMTVLDSSWSQIDKCHYVNTVWMTREGEVREKAFPEVLLQSMDDLPLEIKRDW
jgi:uncharacterized protein YodC (DUF2158 family)